jgi:hypothetical protein
VRIEVVAGYTAAGSTPGTGEVAVPADLMEACYEQATHVFLHRKSVGQVSASVGGGSVSRAREDLELLESVLSVCKAYRRPW